MSLVIAVGFVAMLALRIALAPHVAEDFIYFFRPWSEYIRSHGYFAALAREFSNYQPLYLYLLVLANLLPISTLAGVKLIALTGDALLAYFTYRVVRTIHPRGTMAATAALVMLAAPTVVLNGSFWGQWDALFTAGLLATLLYLLRDRPVPACVAYGLAISLKLQAVFFAPLLVVAWLMRRLRWWHLLIVPAVHLLVLHPALWIGRPLSSLLGIYLQQAGKYKVLQMSTPNVYQWLPESAYDLLAPAGIVVTAVVVGAVVLGLSRRQLGPEPRPWVSAALAFLLVVPLLLPSMHERYFFAADVFSVVYAFAFPRRAAVAVLTVLASLLAYMPYLFGRHPPLGLVAVAVVATTAFVVVALFRDTGRRAAERGAAA